MIERVEDGFDDAQLRTLLKTLGASPRGKMKRETMLAKIAELQKTANRTSEPTTIDTVLGLSGVTPEVVVRRSGISHEQVLEAVKANIARGMEVKFDEWGWVFTRKGRSDSGNLNMPLSVIVQCANSVCIELPKATAIGDPARYA
jgi:hypothetical protein